MPSVRENTVLSIVSLVIPPLKFLTSVIGTRILIRSRHSFEAIDARTTNGGVAEVEIEGVGPTIP